MIERAENGDYLCPLLAHEYEWDEQGMEQIWTWEPCRTPLHVEQSFLGMADAYRIPQDAITSAWSIECENGHVLARSGAEEDAEPFDFGAWLDSFVAVLRRKSSSSGVQDGSAPK